MDAPQHGCNSEVAVTFTCADCLEQFVGSGEDLQKSFATLKHPLVVRNRILAVWGALLLGAMVASLQARLR